MPLRDGPQKAHFLHKRGDLFSVAGDQILSVTGQVVDVLLRALLPFGQVVDLPIRALRRSAPALVRRSAP